MTSQGGHARLAPRLYFEPSARIQRFLGRELIADPNLALLEFVKNAYDADAREVYVDFYVSDRDRARQEIVISDNGHGMNLESFEQNWMRPGNSSKAGAERTPRYERVPIGEKGLGRLAAGRLGDKMEVLTRSDTGAPYLNVTFDWTFLGEMRRRFNEIPVPYAYSNELSDARFPPGTIGRIPSI